ncbi:hypothetical protein SLS62_005307 [Diatrype stigma]|uniref:F-box domain-containing protein n=1 Tax=Diatrype stigma TaxID=117547 RepID=A0AAN9UV50_9PEZI
MGNRQSKKSRLTSTTTRHNGKPSQPRDIPSHPLPLVEGKGGYHITIPSTSAEALGIPEILNIIFGNLAHHDLVRCRRVCRLWYRVVMLSLMTGYSPLWRDLEWLVPISEDLLFLQQQQQQQQQENQQEKQERSLLATSPSAVAPARRYRLNPGYRRRLFEQVCAAPPTRYVENPPGTVAKAVIFSQRNFRLELPPIAIGEWPALLATQPALRRVVLEFYVFSSVPYFRAAVATGCDFDSVDFDFIAGRYSGPPRDRDREHIKEYGGDGDGEEDGEEDGREERPVVAAAGAAREKKKKKKTMRGPDWRVELRIPGGLRLRHLYELTTQGPDLRMHIAWPSDTAAPAAPSLSGSSSSAKGGGEEKKEMRAGETGKRMEDDQLTIRRVRLAPWTWNFGVSDRSREERDREYDRTGTPALEAYDEFVVSVRRKGQEGVNLVEALGREAACDIFHKIAT